MYIYIYLYIYIYIYIILGVDSEGGPRGYAPPPKPLHYYVTESV